MFNGTQADPGAAVLLLTGVCLGRTPGFRRKEVDRALAQASFDGW